MNEFRSNPKLMSIKVDMKLTNCAQGQFYQLAFIERFPLKV